MNISQDTAKKVTILVVDDTPDNLTFISGLLKDLYRVKVANNGEKALAIALTQELRSRQIQISMDDFGTGYRIIREIEISASSALR